MEDRVLKLVKENLGYEIDRELSVEDSIEGLSIDSIIFIRIVVALEEEFGIEVDDEMLVFEEGSQLSYFIEMVNAVSA